MSSIFGRLSNLAKGVILSRDQAEEADPVVEAELSGSSARPPRPKPPERRPSPAPDDEAPAPPPPRTPRPRTL
jgi:hypothetical protein